VAQHVGRLSGHALHHGNHERPERRQDAPERGFGRAGPPRPLAEIALGGILAIVICGSDATVYNDCCIRSTAFTLKISAFVVAKDAI
jgi:hypothetical protein